MVEKLNSRPRKRLGYSGVLSQVLRLLVDPKNHKPSYPRVYTAKHFATYINILPNA
ncbi:hypothetical protein GCM10007159_23570 [Modicisalibacter luteus]|nr:hypothetical protein GCM10007159_23570 [Halomonas lutea]